MKGALALAEYVRWGSSQGGRPPPHSRKCARPSTLELEAREADHLGWVGAGTLLMDAGRLQEGEAVFHAMTSEHKADAYPWLALGVYNLRSWHLYTQVLLPSRPVRLTLPASPPECGRPCDADLPVAHRGTRLSALGTACQQAPRPRLLSVSIRAQRTLAGA